MSHRDEPKKMRKRGRALGVALAASVLVAGCDGVLDVEVPGLVPLEDAFVPQQAGMLVNSAIADIECALSDFAAFEAAGYETVNTRTVGWWGGAFEFPATAPNNCSTAATSRGWWQPIQKGRWMAEEVYDHLENEWTVEQVPDREELMATAAIYAGLAYTHLGEHYCEVTAEGGPLMSWDETIGVGEDWFTRALGHVSNAGDFPLAAGIAPSARQMAHLLRARAHLARGNTTEALADAQQVQQGFQAHITRDSGGERERWNRFAEVHIGLGWVALLGPVDWWDGPNREPHPVTGQTWPEVIPFTGYWNLAVLPDGRAISAEQHPITTDEAGAVADPRVPVTDLNSVGGPNDYPLFQQAKYTSTGDDLPLAKWEEAWLIQAEIQGGQEAINLVNEIRSAHGLPLISGAYEAELLGDGDALRDMIIEERRRTNFLEGRFWSTKLQNDDILWFPRGEGSDRWNFGYLSGVRMVMANSEFQQNPNLEEDDRGTLCPPGQNPVAD